MARRIRVRAFKPPGMVFGYFVQEESDDPSCDWEPGWRLLGVFCPYRNSDSGRWEVTGEEARRWAVMFAAAMSMEESVATSMLEYAMANVEVIGERGIGSGMWGR